MILRDLKVLKGTYRYLKGRKDRKDRMDF